MPKHPVALAIALAFASSLMFSGCERIIPFTEQEHIQRAKDFEDKGNLKGSIIELKNVLQKNPDNPQARLLLGQVYLKTGMGADAEKEFSQAEKLGVSHESIQLQLGEAFLLMGEYQRVLDEIQPGERTSKGNLARILQLRADALLKQGKLKEACNLFQQSLDSDTSHPPTYWGLARCAVAERDLMKAREWLDAALKIKDKQARTWIFFGSLEQLNNNTQGALAAYTNALKSDPDNLDALTQRININLTLGHADMAKKDLDHVLKLVPKSVIANYILALFYFREAKFPEAREALQEVFKITDNYPPSVVLAGATAFALGSYQQAESYLNRVLADFPNNAYARRVLAATLLKQGKPDKSVEILSPLLASNSKDSQALTLAGEAYLWMKDYSRAMGYLQRASTLDPENITIRTRIAAGLLGEGDSDGGLAALAQASRLSAQPGQADLALIMLHLHRREFDQAQKAINTLEKELPSNPLTQNLLAAALLGKQDRSGARKALERALAIQPTFFPAAINLARLDMEDNKPEVARKRLESILTKDKNNIQAMMALANLAGVEQNDSEAVAWLEKAVKADPKPIQPRAMLTRYYMAKKDHQKALALANEMVATQPDNLEALNLLGATQMIMGNLPDSIATFTRMTHKAPKTAAPLLNLGLAQLSNKQISDARITLQKAIKLKPDFLQALDALIRVELVDNKPETALKIARQMQAQQPKSPAGYDREANILMAQKKYAEATKAFESAMARGGDSNTVIKLSHALLLNGNREASEQKLGNWIQEHPKDAVVRIHLAGIYLSTGRNGQAIAEYEKSQPSVSNNVLVLNNLAVLYQQAQDKRALPIAEQAMKLDPENPAVLDTLGWILVNLGQVPRGLNLLKNAVLKAPKAANIRYHYAVALSKAGNKGLAKQELEKAVGSSQNFTELEAAKALLKSL